MVADGVIIEDNTPTSMAPGSSKNVQITINKGTVEGFAKLELQFPEGLEAIPVQTNGASFSFTDQKAKFIWMSLPSDQEFTIAYELKAKSNASGTKVIKGTFSYIKENQRVDYELQSKVIAIGEEMAATTETGSGNKDIASTELETNSTTSGEQPTVDAPYLNDDGSGMRCLRSVTDLGNNEYIINLNVVENELNGFAKIQESIPAGYTISEEDSDGAVVTIDMKGIKFVWFESPQMQQFFVKYRLAAASTNSSIPNITGVFSYVENNAPKEVPVIDITAQPILAINGDPNDTETKTGTSDAVKSTVDANSSTENIGNQENDTNDSTAQNNDNATNSSESIADNGGAVEETEPIENEQEETGTTTAQEVEETNVQEVIAAQEKEIKNAATSVPAPETGVTYRVQIAASHQVVQQSYFERKHGFKRRVNIENHKGWMKYTTGSHKEYKGARDERNQIRENHSFRGPFVTAYNEGERITVQEALMITKQKWYQ